MDYKQLSERYTSCLVGYNTLIYNSDTFSTENEINQLLDFEKDLSELGTEIYSLGILSRNEEIDDIHTNDLKFLLYMYLTAEARRTIKNARVSRDHIQRRGDLESIRALYFGFLNEILLIENAISKETVELMGSEKIKLDSLIHNEIKKDRNTKIMRFKKIKELKLQLDLFIKSNFFYPDEAENREMYIKLINLFFLETVEQIIMIESELQILEYVNSNKESVINNDVQTYSNTEKPKLNVQNILPNVKYLTSGSTAQKNNQDFSFINVKERFQSKVFGPSHTLPTISIAEAADIELAQAKEYEKTADDMRRAKEIRDRVLNDKEYSKEEEEDEYKARSWDDWKDLNPKGHGNTIKNVG
ncbi:hypothetical protein FG386_002278 [Cryptosporidium ryanae]|uniref:uncharacterized protein n=1 Tax=Cryptosporidium ryanae TaxID=515981 RepID=UPI00351A9A03|nr:hypothetical protein FG386_002278 [Cryptosporidium ryanae]